MSDLEDLVQQMLERMLEMQKDSQDRERELMDRVIAMGSPNAARLLLQQQLALQTPPAPTSKATVKPSPPPYPDDPAPTRRPLLTPEDTRFLQPRPDPDRRIPRRRDVTIPGTEAATVAIASASAALAAAESEQL